ncbi:MAG: hypothetical protein LBV68_05395 [Spirochaetaceae bacterium]|jgi:hypothetical protein|nr:hypothetical protein [Spirochaetaceae bacterium]
MPQISYLELYQAINYVKNNDLDPFDRGEDKGEFLFCFEQGEAGETGEEGLRLIEAGFELFDAETHPEIELPQGIYFFRQERKRLSKNEIIRLSAEIEIHAQHTGFKLANKLYLRYLFEDGKQVTQFFRPCFSGNSKKEL